MATFYGYTRGSTAKQIITLDVQRATIEQYHRLKCPELTWGDIYTDAATSGTVPFSDRPVGQVLNQRMERGDHVAFAKLDRGFRNMRDFVFMKDSWLERGVIIHAIDLAADSRTPVGNMVLNILASVAEMERARIAERTAEAKAYARAHGLPLNGQAGIGFRWVGPGHGAKRRKVPDLATREVMGWIVTHRDEGYSWHDLWEHLMVHQVRTREGKLWTQGRIRRAYSAELKLRGSAAVPCPEARTNGDAAS